MKCPYFFFIILKITDPYRIKLPKLQNKADMETGTPPGHGLLRLLGHTVLFHVIPEALPILCPPGHHGIMRDYLLSVGFYHHCALYTIE